MDLKYKFNSNTFQPHVISNIKLNQMNISSKPIDPIKTRGTMKEKILFQAKHNRQ